MFIQGPAQLDIYSITTGDAKDTLLLSITRTQQDLNQDLTFEVNQAFNEQFSQASQLPGQTTSAGGRATVTVGIQDVTNLDLLAIFLNQTVLANVGGDKAIRGQDNSGLVLPRRWLEIIPYVGGALDPNLNNHIIVPAAQATAETISNLRGLQNQSVYTASFVSTASAATFAGQTGETHYYLGDPALVPV